MSKISVIVPVYNVEAFLSRCIHSILCQDFSDFELLLVDDGSTDTSGKICDEYEKKESRIKVIHKKNGGLFSARKAGIENSNADFVTFIDSDDWVEKDYLSHLYQLITQYNADFVMAENVRLSDFDDKVENRKTNNVILLNQKEFLTKLFKIGTQQNVQYLWAKLFKKELFTEDVWPFGLTNGEDVLQTFNLTLKSQKIVYSNKVIYNYFINPNSITCSKFNKNTLDLLKVWDLIVDKANLTNNEWIIKNAELNRYRSDFGILMNYAISSRDPVFSEQIQKCLTDLKSHKKILLKADIPFSRKILISLCCFSYSFTTKILNVKSIKKFI